MTKLQQNNVRFSIWFVAFFFSSRKLTWITLHSQLVIQLMSVCRIFCGSIEFSTDVCFSCSSKFEFLPIYVCGLQLGNNIKCHFRMNVCRAYWLTGNSYFCHHSNCSCFALEKKTIFIYKSFEVFTMHTTIKTHTAMDICTQLFFIQFSFKIKDGIWDAIATCVIWMFCLTAPFIVWICFTDGLR